MSAFVRNIRPSSADGSCGTICTTQPPPEIMVLRMRDVMSDAPAIEAKRSEIVGTQLKAGRQRLAELPKVG